MKEFKVPNGIRTHSGEGQVFWSQRLNTLNHGRPTDIRKVTPAIWIIYGMCTVSSDDEF
jgi:hypothetical protein